MTFKWTNTTANKDEPVENSSEGVALSMSQWYPKMAEYDFEGGMPDPYYSA